VPVVYDEPLVDDLPDRLLEQRIVMVSGTLDLPRATEAAARLMLLDGSGDDPIRLVMSCPDGDLVAATALADTVELVGVELRTVCSGSVGGPAVLPFALGARRLVQPHASFRLSEPTLELQGRASELADATARHADLLGELHGRVAAATGQPVAVIAEDFRRRRLLTAEEAKAYGLVDEIIRRGGLRSV
jgi:ATP-dependent Clp protease protease subunit